VGLLDVHARSSEVGQISVGANSHGCTRAVGRPIPGVNAFSTPVFDHDGQVALVLTLLGHQDHVPSAWTSPMAVAVRQAAAEVSRRLGYRTR
jgi:DNA-binding IclR family transcriptional regulator